jgi:hypothetical protein
MKSTLFHLLVLAVSEAAVVKSALTDAPAPAISLPQFKVPGVVRKKLRYGPYVVPGANEPTVGIPSDPRDKKGALSMMKFVDSVCTDCTVLTNSLTLEYENGTHASINTGIYNHHTAIYNVNKKERLITCPGAKFQMPKVAGAFVGGTSDDGYGLYTNGDGTTKAGYYIAPNDKFYVSSETMNYATQSQTIYFTVEAEYIPGKPPGYLDTQILVLSAAPCAEVIFNPTSPKYTMKSANWQVPADGIVVNMRGHLHDGGTSVEIALNGENRCTSIASYGGSPDYVKKGADGQVWETISDMKVCSDPVPVKKGDNVTVTASYDTTAHPLRASNMDNMEGVMGLGILSIAFPLGYDMP